MANFIVAGILIIMIGSAVIYIVKAKKKGTKCIGCSAGECSSSKDHGQCGCRSHTSEQTGTF